MREAGEQRIFFLVIYVTVLPGAQRGLLANVII